MEEDLEEKNRDLDLGLSIGVPKSREKKRQKYNFAPCLQLSFSLSHSQEEGIIVKGSEEEDEENGNSKNFQEISRKKLRLSKEQSTLLECSFTQHSTLNPVQKHSLAEKLKLTPRQVEVWFQNRRARTKLKQTEADCKFLKKTCESLSKENLRLKKELQELKSQKFRKSQLCLLNLPICSSCDQRKPTF
ncbi:Homeobox-leucine zipper protein family [Euphorbia peplus]|nr:Homeobox-leucine zipper protein family [Euphorbia peplus]